MEVLEHIDERSLAGERREDVVHADEHRSLPFVRIARGPAHAREVEELREGLRDLVGVREADLMELRAELLRGVRRRRVDCELDEERLDEAEIGRASCRERV